MMDAIEFLKLIPIWSDMVLAVANSVSNLCVTEKRVHGFVTGLMLQHARNNGSVCVKTDEMEGLMRNILTSGMSYRMKAQLAEKLVETVGGPELTPSPDGDESGEYDALILKCAENSGLFRILHELSQKSFYEKDCGLGAGCLQFADDEKLMYEADGVSDSDSAISVDAQIRNIKVPVILSLGRLYISRYFAYEIRIAGFIRTALKKESIKFGSDGDESSTGFTMENIHNVWTEVYGVLSEAEKEINLKSGKKNADTDVNWQKVAVAMSLCHPFSIITGGPGTGKTYTVSVLICLLKKINRNLRIGIAAPTGKAAARVKESLNAAFGGLFRNAYEKLYPNLIDEIAPAETIHKMLGVHPGKSTSRVNEANPLDYDVLIIDEVSMMDVFLMNRVFAGLKPGAKLILLGDKDQLSSVEAGSVLGDICTVLDAKREITDYELKVVSRLTGYSADELMSKPGLAPGIASLHKSRRYESSPLIGFMAGYVNAGKPYSEIGKELSEAGIGVPLIVSSTNPHDRFAAVTSADVTSHVKGVAVVNGCDREFIDALCEKTVKGWRLDSERSRFGEFDLPENCADYRDYLQFMAEHPVLGVNGQGDDKECSVATAFGMINRFRVLCPERQGYFGIKYINDRISGEALRFVRSRISDETCPDKNGFSKIWYPGLLLMITKNEPNLELRNGDVVICGYAEGYGHSKRVWVQAENGSYRSISFGMLSDYETGFAMTIHKSQGSEFDHTMMIMNGTEKTITRELVYTGITRAKSFVSMIVGNDGNGDTANLNGRFAGRVSRSSGLGERLYGKTA